jgi:hypothetical protein
MEGAIMTMSEDEKLRSDGLRELGRYWEEKRKARIARGLEAMLPCRSDIDPVELRRQLGHLVLIDRLPAGDLVYRLVGIEVAARARADFTGEAVDTAGRGPEFDSWIKSLRLCVQQGQPILARGVFPWRAEAGVECEWGMFPLAGDGRVVDKVLAGVFFPPVERKRFSLGAQRPATLYRITA